MTYVIPLWEASTARALVHWVLPVTFRMSSRVLPLKLLGRAEGRGLPFFPLCGMLEHRRQGMQLLQTRFLARAIPPLPPLHYLVSSRVRIHILSLLCALKPHSERMFSNYWGSLSPSSPTPKFRLKCLTAIITGITLNHL